MTRPRWTGPVVAIAVFGTAIGIAWLSLTPLTGRSLTTHVERASASARLVAGRSDELELDDCPRYRVRSTWPAPAGATRDAHGFTIWEVDGPDVLTVLVVGDSVVDRDLARRLADAFAAAGRGARIVDTSLFGYGWADEACVAAQARQAYDVDLALVGLCLNDLPVAGAVRADVGAGPSTYELTSEVGADLRADLPPLLLPSTHPWVHARWPQLDAQFPTSRRDASGPEVLADAVAALQATPRPALDDLVEALGALPTAFLVFPLNAHMLDDPTDPLLDWTLDRVRDAGGTAVDLRPLWMRLGVVDLSWEAPPTPEHLADTPYDLVHVVPAALGFAADAALGSLHADDGMAGVRSALLDAAALNLAMGARDCAPVPMELRDGIVRPGWPCSP